MDESVKQEFRNVYSILKCKANCGSVGKASLPLNSIQFNKDGVLQGSPNLIWDEDINTLTVGGATPGCILNVADDIIELGDINFVNNGTSLIVYDAIKVVSIATDGNFSVSEADNSGVLFRVDVANKKVYVGDSNSHYVSPGTYIEIDVLLGLIKLTTVPTFVNDAAAIGGGLTSGHLYKTTTLGVTSLNIVP